MQTEFILSSPYVPWLLGWSTRRVAIFAFNNGVDRTAVIRQKSQTFFDGHVTRTESHIESAIALTGSDLEVNQIPRVYPLQLSNSAAQRSKEGNHVGT